MEGQQETTGPSTSGALPTITSPGAVNKAVLEARRKFGTALEDELLDYKKNHPLHIEACADTLIKIFSNVLDHPAESKYCQVKASGNTFKKSISDVRGGEHLMLLAGWQPKVMNLERYFVFEGIDSAIKTSILAECRAALNKAIHTIHEKAERKRKEMEGKAARDKAVRDQILLQIEDDRIDRKLKTETQTFVSPVAASKLPSEQRQDATTTHSGSGLSGPSHKLQDDDDDQ